MFDEVVSATYIEGESALPIEDNQRAKLTTLFEGLFIVTPRSLIQDVKKGLSCRPSDDTVLNFLM